MKINGNISENEVKDLIENHNLTFDMFLKSYLKVKGFNETHTYLIGATIKITTWSRKSIKEGSKSFKILTNKLIQKPQHLL